jgi:UDP:flavonoid glycosyltransferase YjiC (YdhE family)
MRESVLAIDIGTFCDNKLFKTAISKLPETYNVHYITQSTNKVQSPFIAYHYENDNSLAQDTELSLVDPSKGLIKSYLKNAKAFPGILKMFYSIIKLASDVIKKNNIKKVIVWYPVMLVILGNFLKDVHFYIVYVAPVIPSKVFPAVFDSILKTKKYKLYKNNIKNFTSSEEFIRRQNPIPKIDFNIEKALTNNITHLMCMNNVVVPKYKPEYNLDYYRLNSIIDDNLRSKIAPLPSDNIVKMINENKDKKLAMLSFGSFGKIKEVRNNIGKILNILDKSGYIIIFHQPPKDYDLSKYKNIIPVNEYIPYEWIVDFLDLVIFTGSICLQDICIYKQTKMIMCPILSEQFLWAKNLEYHTGQPYYDILKQSTSEFKKILNFDTDKQISFLKKASNSMRRSRTPERILEIMKKKYTVNI